MDAVTTREGKGSQLRSPLGVGFPLRDYLSVIDGGPDAPERVPVLRRRADLERALVLGEQALALIQEAAALTIFGYEDDIPAEDWISDLRPLMAQTGEFVVIRWETADYWDPERLAQIQRENEALLAGA